MHEYRDIHEYHDGCYYCVYNQLSIDYQNAGKTHPPVVCEQCPTGLEGYHRTVNKRLMNKMKLR